MISAKKYLEFFDGNKEEAIIQLEKSVTLYINNRIKTPKVLKRAADYKRLLSEILELKK